MEPQIGYIDENGEWIGNGIETNIPTPPSGYDTLIDDLGNVLTDDVGNILIFPTS